MAILRVDRYALIASLLVAGLAYAQESGKPLDLHVPLSKGFPQPASAATTSGSSANTATISSSSATRTSANPNTAPGVYYGDTSGARLSGTTADSSDDATDTCDNKPQVHGSVETGVVAGNHFNGSYQAGTVNVTEPAGDCTHPTEGVSVSVGVSQGHFDYSNGHR